MQHGSYRQFECGKNCQKRRFKQYGKRESQDIKLEYFFKRRLMASNFSSSFVSYKKHKATAKLLMLSSTYIIIFIVD